MLKIRQENKKDYPEVYEVIKKAFLYALHSDGNEHNLVNKLRNSTCFIPELSLVATIDEKIVGYILFTKIEIENNTELALAPLAVLPEYQKQGIGKSLIETGHKIAQNLGYHYSIVLGIETYYPKFGYQPASKWDIKAPFEVKDENFMAVQLNKPLTPVSGIVKYAKEFEIE